MGSGWECGAQVGQAPRVAGQARTETGRRRLGLVPVAPRHAVVVHPDLADGLGPALGVGLGIDDAQHRATGGRSVGDEAARARGVAVDEAQLPPRQRRGIDEDFEHVRPLLDGMAGGAAVGGGDDARGLGQTPARTQGAPAQPRGRELGGELLQRAHAHRLGAVDGAQQGAEVQRADLLRRDAGGSQPVGEVGPGRVRDAEAAQRLDPARGPLREQAARQHASRHAAQHRREHAVDQPQVVERRQPGQHPRIGVVAEAQVEVVRVAQQVAVAQRHALGHAGGARGELQHRDVVAVAGHGVGQRRVVQRVHAHPMQRAQRRLRLRRPPQQQVAVEGQRPALAQAPGEAERLEVAARLVVVLAVEARGAGGQARIDAHVQVAQARSDAALEDQVEPGRGQQGDEVAGVEGRLVQRAIAAPEGVDAGAEAQVRALQRRGGLGLQRKQRTGKPAQPVAQGTPPRHDAAGLHGEGLSNGVPRSMRLGKRVRHRLMAGAVCSRVRVSQ